MRDSTKNQLLYASPLAFIDGMFFGMITVLFSWWMVSVKLPISSITKIEAIIGSAFAFKFLWVPIFDMLPFYKLLQFFCITKNNIFHRRGWILLLVYLSCISMYFATMIDPILNSAINYKFILYICIAVFCMASASSVMVAYNCETLEPEDMSITTIAYKIGILSSASITTMIQEQFNIPWFVIFRMLSITIIILVSTMFVAPSDKDLKQKNIKDAFIGAYIDLYRRVKTIRQKVISSNQYPTPQLKRFFYALSPFAIYITLGFIIACKSQDRLCAPVEKFFIVDTAKFSKSEYSAIQILSKTCLPICAIMSTNLIKQYNYTKSFVFIVLMNAMVPVLYILYSQANIQHYYLFYMSALCGMCIIYFLISSSNSILKNKINNKNIVQSIGFILSFVFFLRYFISEKIFTIPFFSAIVIVTANKMIYTIKSAMLYNYQKDLASPNYTLSQMTIMLSIEKFVAMILTSISGSLQVQYGWFIFYCIVLCISLLPMTFMVFGAVFERDTLYKIDSN